VRLGAPTVVRLERTLAHFGLLGSSASPREGRGGRRTAWTRHGIRHQDGPVLMRAGDSDRRREGPPYGTARAEAGSNRRRTSWCSTRAACRTPDGALRGASRSERSNDSGCAPAQTAHRLGRGAQGRNDTPGPLFHGVRVRVASPLAPAGPRRTFMHRLWMKVWIGRVPCAACRAPLGLLAEA
jgi:hypothetical protein